MSGMVTILVVLFPLVLWHLFFSNEIVGRRFSLRSLLALAVAIAISVRGGLFFYWLEFFHPDYNPLREARISPPAEPPRSTP